MIPYFGLPMTPIKDMITAIQRRHAMVSYAHPGQIALAAEVATSVVLDNGAFTAWKSGQPYNFDGYLEWAHTWLKHPAVDWCVIPDVIDGDERDNDRLLHAWQLSNDVSVPVFHLHESDDRLWRLMDAYPRIALGSSGKYKDPGTAEWWSRMAEVMDIVCDPEGMPRVKLHGLRMLDPDFLSQLPLSSADSTNVARNAGDDTRWRGTYTPPSVWSRFLVMMDRIETHAKCRRWNRENVGMFRNWELIG